MGPRPAGYSIDRINNDLGYRPDNCRWASRLDQQRNRRVTRKVTIEGKEYVVSELAARTGRKADTIIQRAALGLSFAEVISDERRAFEGGWRQAVAARLAKAKTATHCKNGHEWTTENTRITKEGWRNCRACHAAKMRKRTAAKKAALEAKG